MKNILRTVVTRGARRSSRAVAAAALGVAVAGIGAVVTPGVASAASSEGYCFVYDMPNAGYPTFQGYTQVIAYYNNRWNAISSLRYSLDGCGTYNISPAWRPYATKVVAIQSIGNATWWGTTQGPGKVVCCGVVSGDTPVRV